MLHLETRIQFQEEVLLSVWIVEVLHCTGTAIAYQFRQTNGVLKGKASVSAIQNAIQACKSASMLVAESSHISPVLK